MYQKGGLKRWDEDALRLKPKHQLEGEKKKGTGHKKNIN